MVKCVFFPFLPSQAKAAEVPRHGRVIKKELPESLNLHVKKSHQPGTPRMDCCPAEK